MGIIASLAAMIGVWWIGDAAFGVHPTFWEVVLVLVAVAVGSFVEALVEELRG